MWRVVEMPSIGPFAASNSATDPFWLISSGGGCPAVEYVNWERDGSTTTRAAVARNVLGPSGEDLGDPGEHVGDRDPVDQQGGDHPANQGHVRGGGETMPADVADDENQTPVVEDASFVPITTDGTRVLGRHVPRRSRHPIDLRQAAEEAAVQFRDQTMLGLVHLRALDDLRAQLAPARPARSATLRRAAVAPTTRSRAPRSTNHQHESTAATPSP